MISFSYHQRSYTVPMLLRSTMQSSHTWGGEMGGGGHTDQGETTEDTEPIAITQEHIDEGFCFNRNTVQLGLRRS